MKHKNKDRDDTLRKQTEVIAELNRKRLELDSVSRELADKESRLKESVNSLVSIENQTELKKREKENYERVLADGNRNISELTEQIELKTGELDKLRSEIDGQIEDNKHRLEDETRQLRENKQKANDDFNEAVKISAKQNKQKEATIKEVAEVKKELEDKRQGYQKLCVEMEVIEKDTKSRNSQAYGSLSHSNEREKKLNFYNVRLQRIAKSMGVQLKEI
jgi:chromosome segregation ATPase